MQLQLEACGHALKQVQVESLREVRRATAEATEEWNQRVEAAQERADTSVTMAAEHAGGLVSNAKLDRFGEVMELQDIMDKELHQTEQAMDARGEERLARLLTDERSHFQRQLQGSLQHHDGEEATVADKNLERLLAQLQDIRVGGQLQDRGIGGSNNAWDVAGGSTNQHRRAQQEMQQQPWQHERQQDGASCHQEQQQTLHCHHREGMFYPDLSNEDLCLQEDDGDAHEESESDDIGCSDAESYTSGYFDQACN